MIQFRFGFGVLLCGAGLGLAACSGAPEADLATQCLMENDVPGAYAFDASTAIPLVSPVDDGTAEGADILNACIQRKASGAQPLQTQMPSQPSNAVCPPGAPVLYKGVYCAQ